MIAIAEYLAEQKRLAEAATEGPWEVDQTEPGIWCQERIVIGNYTALDMFESPAWEDGTPEDLAFIAAARESVPRLVAALEAVRHHATQLRDETRSRFSQTGGSPARDLGYADACDDVLTLIEDALGGESE